MLGCIPWVIMLAYLGERLGANWEKIRPYLHYADYVVVFALVALVVWAVRWRRGGGAGRAAPDRVTSDEPDAIPRDAVNRRSGQGGGHDRQSAAPGSTASGLALDLWNAATFRLRGYRRGHRRSARVTTPSE